MDSCSYWIEIWDGKARGFLYYTRSLAFRVSTKSYLVNVKIALVYFIEFASAIFMHL